MAKKMSELNIQSSAACLDVFKDYDELEIKDFSPAIQSAWECGREVSARMAEIDANFGVEENHY